MALSLKVSHSLETLSEALASDLRSAPAGVFRPQYIVTQTTGMNNWLKMRIAGLNNIAANIMFERPNDMLYQLYFKLDGPKEQVLSADQLQWVLFSLLKLPEFDRRFPRIAAYFSGDDELKRLGLAAKAADLFDQYQVYRPEMIARWNAAAEADQADDWQCWLWCRAKERLRGEMPDKTLIRQYITEALADPEKAARLRDRLPVLHLFGISILTVFHIDIFSRLAQHLPVHFYILNPSPGQYWYDDRSEAQIARWNRRMEQRGLLPGYAPPLQGNELLTSWGRVIRETFSMLFENEVFLNEYTTLPGSAVFPGTLLGKVQQDIFENAVGEDRQPVSAQDLADGSITINACYTPAREVEALYNFLVRQAEIGGGNLSPRDIVVMVSDIDAYAPYIRAVFGAAPYKFPFNIADESYQATDGFFSTLQALMELEEENFRAENVLQLLELRYVRERFRISDTRLIRSVVGLANIRFGISGRPEDGSDSVSWMNGLKRIIYGICLHGGEPYEGLPGGPLYPLDRVEGEQAFELVRFVHFVEVMISAVRDQAAARTLLDWGKYLQEAVNRLIYEPEGEEDPDYALFVRQLERLNVAAAGITEEFSFDVFRQHYIRLLSGEMREGNFISGGITFCSLIPMRSIPFRIVCLMGMNYDKFPRREAPLSFSLMDRTPQKGDRNVKENDKHLFLETLLSARERLYLSYLGRSQKDNSSLPPSALLDELADYIAAGAGVARESVLAHLLKVQPLHSFSPRYADRESGLYTYLGDTASGTGFAESADPVAPEFDFGEIRLDALIAFFKNPFKFYYNQVLSVYEDDEEVLLADTELFDLDALQQWQLKYDLLLLGDDELPPFAAQAKRTGKLPLANMGELAMARMGDAVADVRELVAPYTRDVQPEQLSFAVAAGEHTITGTFDRIYNGRILVPAFSKRERKYHIESWLRYLAAAAAGLDITVHYIAGNSASETVLQPGLMTPAGAAAQLAALAALYVRGHQAPLRFMPDLEPKIDNLQQTDDAGFEGALAKLLENPWGITPDPYLLREFQSGFMGTDGALAEWLANTAAILDPLKPYFDEE